MMRCVGIPGCRRRPGDSICYKRGAIMKRGFVLLSLSALALASACSRQEAAAPPADTAPSSQNSMQSATPAPDSATPPADQSAAPAAPDASATPPTTPPASTDSSAPPKQ